ncbi:hypothetical protein K443DRAFT_171726 [Laccaria amethystina LaAM-08-1]|uniref:Uncharacterized protein n=1 Tax=Laccaria amethystina LaAM-08-1 TaxID=1095629 RepID=A0A0C9XPG8_9AGAR|nr:hypothetical protein K443DRAFT_171726 [Laccaria amethystina LaAM-08-1]
MESASSKSLITPLSFPAALLDESRAAVHACDVGYSELDKGLVGTSLQWILTANPSSQSYPELIPGTKFYLGFKLTKMSMLGLLACSHPSFFHDALIAIGEDVSALWRRCSWVLLALSEADLSDHGGHHCDSP